MRDGKISSTNEDPLALAIKEHLGDYKFPDIVAIGDDDIYLHYKGKSWISFYDVLALYRTTSNQPRSIRLKFQPFQLQGNP
jgi:hypothetical protein